MRGGSKVGGADTGRLQFLTLHLFVEAELFAELGFELTPTQENGQAAQQLAHVNLRGQVL